MKVTSVLKMYFGMKDYHNLEGYTKQDGEPISSDLQGFVAELKRLSPEEKMELATLAAKELNITEPLEA